MSAAETATDPARALHPGAARGAMASKFWGAYNVARLAQIRDCGSLTLVSGVLGVRPLLTATLQGAIDAAIDGLVQELAPVRVKAVSPGTVETPLRQWMFEGKHRQLFEAEGERLTVGRVGLPDDVGRTILFLIIQRIPTGSTMLVDGGGAIA